MQNFKGMSTFLSGHTFKVLRYVLFGCLPVTRETNGSATRALRSLAVVAFYGKTELSCAECHQLNPPVPIAGC